MYTDPLSQTPTYQRIFKEGYEEGYEEGLREGDLIGLRKSILIVIEVCFSSLMELAQEQVSKSSNTDMLDYVFKVLLRVPDEETVRILIDLLPT